MPKGIPKNGINAGRFKKTTIDAELDCFICKNKFIVPEFRKNIARFCSSRCYNEARSMGLYRNDIHRDCEWCGKSYTINKARLETTRFCSFNCKQNGIVKRGVKKYYCCDCNIEIWVNSIRCNICSYKYIGRYNKSSLTQKIRSSSMYHMWKKLILERDNFCCVLCNKEDKLHVDHILPLKYIKYIFKIKSIDDAKKCSFLWNIDNGRVLCENCHRKTDTYGNKKNLT